MRDRRTLPVLILLLAAAFVPAASARDGSLPRQFNPGVDGRPVYVTDAASGAVWAAWPYRSRGEFDIAVAVRDAAGTWSDPAFIGRFDGFDQTSPALVSDASGNLYLAYAVRQTSQIFLTVLPRGAAGWGYTRQLTSRDERCFSPALAVVADRLVLGYRSFDGRVQIRDLPLFSPPMSTRGIYDNPDGTDPLGMDGGGDGIPPSDNGGFKPTPGGTGGSDGDGGGDKK